MVFDQKELVVPNPKETGEVLFYLVGSKTDELMNDEELLQTLGIDKNDREDAYIEIMIMNMFVMVKQYTAWEKDEFKYTRALDQMHFLFFHQLKELSNYDEDDIEQLHNLIFERYDEYGEFIAQNVDINWTRSLSEAFLDNINNDLEEKDKSILQLAKQNERFYKSIPKILQSL